MPELAPFRALRYTAQAGPLADLVAPPYDIISPAEHAALCRRSPHNVAHLILGTRARPDGPPPDGWHAAAAAALAAWRHNGVLRADPEPAFYLYTQTFDHGGRRRARKLLLAALRLDPYEAARVLPHEDTMPGPKADRLRLMQAAAANLSPILTFFPDHGGRVNDQLDALNTALPALDFADEHGVGHQLRLITDPADKAELTATLYPLPLYIADGHHRYETALAYQSHRRTADPGHHAPQPYDHTLAACMSSADPGLVIRPSHRMARWTHGPHPLELLDRAAKWFSVSRLPAQSPEEALAALEPRTGHTRFVVYTGAPGGYALLELLDPRAMADAPYPPHSPVRRLAAAVLGHGFLFPLLGGQPNVTLGYTPDAGLACRQVERGQARVAGLLPPVHTAELMAVVDAGERMPPKSTYFWPKPLTGIALRILTT